MIIIIIMAKVTHWLHLRPLIISMIILIIMMIKTIIILMAKVTHWLDKTKV